MINPDATLEEVRQQLFQDAQTSRDTSVTMYEQLAMRAREEGRLEDAARYHESAERERLRPLPNAA